MQRIWQALVLGSAALLALPRTAFAADEEQGILSPRFDLGIWTIVIFVLLLLILRKFAWGPLLEIVDLVNVEGIAFALQDLEERLASDEGRGVVLEAARAIERVPELLGLGPHLLLTARRRD